MVNQKQIIIVKNGPYIVKGNVPLDELIMVTKGGHREYQKGRTFESKETYALCRCGHSKNPPFCDGCHEKINFQGHETADTRPFEERAKVFKGETLDLLDDGRCAFARFCHREDGDTWTLTQKSGDEYLRREAIQSACDCPTGRLVQRDKTTADHAEFEPAFEPSISILQDPDLFVSGPLYVKGDILLIGADGTEYERRNRYALCRCGSSFNKPFCDASHLNIEYRDGLDDDESLSL